MTINVNKPAINFRFEDIDSGECFIYNGDYFMVAYDEDEDEWFGVNLVTGDKRKFDGDEHVTSLTAIVSFKETQ